ncbi:oxysterol-binding protein [Elysia marginata]|uniref:Oxysterol-binding protein n=1 Tax=Elysia marginata TaxID=1093978 RepID=A0AAV4GVP1_9GAST|nr:oxysterol-binding protein [Elysia marginata]
MSSVDKSTFESTRLRVVATSHTKIKRISATSITNVPPSQKQAQAVEYRDALPAVMVNRKEISLWTILKSCIGKDLTKITFPVALNEPISMIQRLSEYMEYSFLLEKAARADNPVDRLEYVCGFVTSALSANWMRPGKPFNAILGETYELVRPEMGFRFLGEQVSHHPPVTAIHADGAGYDFHGSIAPGLSFWGKSVDVTPKGTLVVDLHKYSETYSWQNVNCYVHNILMGELWMELHGNVNLTCNRNEMRATLSFKQAGWSSKDLHFVEGFIYNGKLVTRLEC